MTEVKPKLFLVPECLVASLLSSMQWTKIKDKMVKLTFEGNIPVTEFCRTFLKYFFVLITELCHSLFKSDTSNNHGDYTNMSFRGQHSPAHKRAAHKRVGHTHGGHKCACQQ